MGPIRIIGNTHVLAGFIGLNKGFLENFPLNKIAQINFDLRWMTLYLLLLFTKIHLYFYFIQLANKLIKIVN